MSLNSFSITRRVGLAACAALCLVSVVLTTASKAVAKPGASTDKNGCSANVQTPHLSSGAGGVIGKANYTCTDVPSTIYLDTKTTGYWLYRCGSSPPQSIQWVEDNCDPAGKNIENVDVTVSDSENIRYVPPEGEGSGQGIGYWISYTTWFSSGPNGTSEDRTDWSAVYHGGRTAHHHGSRKWQPIHECAPCRSA